MEAVTVDIVLSFHNGSKYIQAQLDSILASVVKPEVKLNVIVIDDGSRPDEFAFLQKVCAQSPKVRLVRNEINLGCIKSFEKGLLLSNAQYVMASDQDDLWLPDKVQRSLDLIRRKEGSEPALVFTDLCVVDEKLQVIRPRMLNLEGFDQSRDKFRILFQNIVAGCTMTMNRKLLDMALPFPINIPMHDHWLAVCAAFGGRMEMLNEPLVLYRQHSGNLVGSPRPRLFYRLLTPRTTLGHLNQSLKAKSELAERLVERMKATGHDRDIEQVRHVSLAFRQRSLKHLAFLVSSRVFKLSPIRLFLTCGAYLLTSVFKFPTATTN